MHVRDWKRFLAEGKQGQLIAFAQLPARLNDYLGGASRTLYLRHDYALKAVRKHDIPPEHFPLIFEAVEYGFALPDKPRHLTFLYFDPHLTERWFQVSVKCCEEDRMNVVATFFRQNGAEVRRRMKKTPPIWPE